jgi:2-(1,2-epoxy-1,2-dihydrophenyl)acetyl-CoA isomerase
VAAVRTSRGWQHHDVPTDRLIHCIRDACVVGGYHDWVEAERIGYFARIWPAETYETELQAFVDSLAQGPTRTYAAWKLAVNRSVLLELDGYTDYERTLADKVRQTQDHAEGRLSFRERREPAYEGR